MHPPAGPGNSDGERRGDVSAMIVGQRVEVDENAGRGTMPLVVAPQEGHLAHLDTRNDTGLPQDGGAASRSGRQGVIVGMGRPPCRSRANQTSIRAQRGGGQLPPPGPLHQNIVRAGSAHTRDHIESPSHPHEAQTDRDGPPRRRNELAFFRLIWRRVVLMTYIALTTTTAPGAQALVAMCGTRMCCCCRPC